MELYEKYKYDVANYLYFLTKDSEITQDLLQETFLKASLGILKFRSQSSVKTWLFSIARNCFIDWLRKKHDCEALDDDTLLASCAVSDSFESSVENFDTVKRLLEILDEKSKTAVIKRSCGYSFGEIAAAIDVSESSARVIYHRAIKKMRRFAEENNFTM